MNIKKGRIYATFFNFFISESNLLFHGVIYVLYIITI